MDDEPAAIQSLDSLNEQIVRYVLGSEDSGHRQPPQPPPPRPQLTPPLEPPPRGPGSKEWGHEVLCGAPAGGWGRHEQEALQSSMALMRKLLVDAQAKFRNMMEDNKALASRIDGDLHQAHQEVSQLRAELQDTNSRIANMASVVQAPPSSQGSASCSVISSYAQGSPTHRGGGSPPRHCPRCRGKGATALVNFCATLNLSHRGFHRKTFGGHVDTMVKAGQATAKPTEAASVQEGIYGCLKIEKKDCLNHVLKWMGTALRTLVERRRHKGSLFGGKGKLTPDKILKNHKYGLRTHRHDVPGMKKAVQATLLRMTSLEKHKQRLSKAVKAHMESEKVKKMAKRHKPNMTLDYYPGLT
ncbi:hypothetical protein HPB47_024126 [Ixodes persulcatus]|uniref:Uncharacterized protein n=1 Tax=Ixodes persulcatus TaxID=34615 RepID=A0AC60Q553_IXOPE|nr:hypothetical protein HPB47_024126 [Ixodes persulcatus]